MRILIVSQKVGDGYGQEKIVSASSSLLQGAGHQVEWLAEICQGTSGPYVFHSLPEIFHINSFTKKVKVKRSLETLWEIAGRSNGIPTLIHFVDHLNGEVFEETAKRFPTVFTAHTAAPTCPASGRVVKGLPVCPQKSGWSCLRYHYRYDCLSAQRTALHRAHSVFEFQRKHKGLKAVRRLLAISHFLEKQLLAEGYKPSRVSFVPNPVEPMDCPAALGTPENLLVCAARLVPMKGIDHLIWALKTIEEEPWSLWILGDGPEREYLAKTVEKNELSSRIRFLGHRPAQETLGIFKSAVAVIQPNLGPEGFGMSIAEASALGKAVIAYDVPGLNEVIENEKTGLLAKYADPSSLALAISRILNNQDLRKSLGEGGRTRMQSLYSPQQHLESTIKNYLLAVGE